MIFKIYRILLKTETAVLVTLLLSMIVISVVQIVMRNFFTSGLLWGDSYVRIAVLWLALIGAMVASRQGKHITIEVLLHLFSKRMQQAVKRVTDTFTACVCFVVAYYSFEFVKIEYEEAGLAFAFVPNWLCESIIPFAFFIIGLRYIVSALLNLRHEA